MSGTHRLWNQALDRLPQVGVRLHSRAASINPDCRVCVAIVFLCISFWENHIWWCRVFGYFMHRFLVPADGGGAVGPVEPIEAPLATGLGTVRAYTECCQFILFLSSA